MSARRPIDVLRRGTPSPRGSAAGVIRGMLASGVMLLALFTVAGAAPPAPPGGHHPTYYGGSNRTGYPPLSATTGVAPGDAATGASFELRGSPNPFIERVTLSFASPAGIAASVRIYSASGRLIRRLMPASSAEAGRRQLTWDGRDGRGRPVGAGIYFARVEAAGRFESLRIARLR